MQRKGYGVRIPAAVRDIEIVSGVQRAMYSMGVRGYNLGVKWPERVADHSLLLGSEFMNKWHYSSVVTCLRVMN